MFFNDVIGLSKTRESEKRRGLEGKMIGAAGSIRENARSITEAQETDALQYKNKIDVGFRKSKSRQLFEEKIDRIHRLERMCKEELGQLVGEIVAESMWIDDDYKAKCRPAIVETSRELVAGLFADGSITFKSFSENGAIAVRHLFDEAREQSELRLEAEEKKVEKERKAVKAPADEEKYRDPNVSDEQEGTEDDDASEASTERREVTRKAIEAVVKKAKENVLATIAAEKEIAEMNEDRNSEVHGESHRIVRPKREAPTLWRSINVGVAKALGESVGEEKAVGESLAIYTFFEALNVMNLVKPTHERIAVVCQKLTEEGALGEAGLDNLGDKAKKFGGKEEDKEKKDKDDKDDKCDK